MLNRFYLPLFLCSLISLAGCASLNAGNERAEERFASAVVTRMALERSGFQAELDAAAGFLVMEVKPSALPGLTRVSRALLVDPASEERRAAKVSNLRMMGGHGETRYDLVMLFAEKADFEQALNGSWSYSTDDSLRLQVVYFAPTDGATVEYDLLAITIAAN